VQRIEDAHTGVLLGSARPAVRRLRWLPTPPILEVREAEDAPLVFTIRRVWSLQRRFEIRDADGYTVGTLTGPIVSRRGDYRLAVRDTDGDFHGNDGSLLARTTREKGGMEIRFAESMAADPFGKMLFLAAVLRQ
jgi:hypothetical protein